MLSQRVHDRGRRPGCLAAWLAGAGDLGGFPEKPNCPLPGECSPAENPQPPGQALTLPVFLSPWLSCGGEVFIFPGIH